MTRLHRRAVLTGTLALAASAALPRTAPARAFWGPLAIPVRTRALPNFHLYEAGQSRFGELDYFGGLELHGDDRHFGGFSGLAMLPDCERFLSLSDQGTWFQGRFVEDRGRLAGVADAVLAPMLDMNGVPLADTRRYDTESLSLIDGIAHVGIERVHDVMRFDIGRQGLAARGQLLPVPEGIKRLPSNLGLEAIGVLPAGPYAGSLIGIAERSSPGPSAPTKGFFIQPRRGEFQVARHDDFSITDLAFLPEGGDMLLLERRFAWITGVAMRIRRIPLREIRPGALLDGPVVIEADMRSNIDNMEGLAIHRSRDGRTLLTLISDDNFSVLQRTVVLRFGLVE
jgi:hypothetical protein